MASTWRGFRVVTCQQAIIWIDEREACILRMDKDLALESRVSLDDGIARALDVEDFGSDSARRRTAKFGYFERVARSLDAFDEILIVGPSAAKTEFLAFMHKNQHAIDPRILGVETIANRTDIELSRFAKLYFTIGGQKRRGNGSDGIK